MNPGQESLIAMLEQAGIPLTRENYIDAAWGEDRPDPWTAEHEAELPDFLQAGYEGDETWPTQSPPRT